MSSVYWTMVHVVPKKSKKKIIHSERNTMYDERVHVPLGNIDHCNKVIFSLRIFCTYLKIRHNVHKFGYLIEWKSIQFVIQSVFRSFNKTLWCGHKKEQLNLFTFSLIFFGLLVHLAKIIILLWNNYTHDVGNDYPDQYCHCN